MILTWLRLQNFRNIEQAFLRFGPGLNLIIGANGQGKSNLLEAVGLLATGRSFRRVPSGMLRRWDQPWLRIHGEVQSQEISHQLDVLGESNRLIVRLDNKPMAAVSVMERVLTAVIITPETPILVRGGPGERRSFLDWVIFSAHRRHGLESREYHRALQARNHLLRLPQRDVRELEAWETHLAVLGARIAVRRFKTLSELTRLLPHFLDALDLVSDRYDMILSSQLDKILTHKEEESAAIERARGFLQEELGRSREGDRRSGTTRVGPHRDDLLFRLEGHPLARVGSRGQQKRFALALKLAEAALLEASLGEPPVMVLDDPASELDQDGIHRLMEVLSAQGRQLFVAAREARDIPWTNRPRVVCAVTAGVFQVTTERANS
ncbi:MAG: DNA replication and repair protein RecF [Magnetococcus sp. YQC-5]